MKLAKAEAGSMAGWVGDNGCLVELGKAVGLVSRVGQAGGARRKVV